MKMSMSNERRDRGPIGTTHALSEEAERCASGAVDSRSDVGAEAIHRRLQAVLGPAPTLGAGTTVPDTFAPPVSWITLFATSWPASRWPASRPSPRPASG